MDEQKILVGEGDDIVAETEWLAFKRSAIHGTGGFARRAIPEGASIIEYVGEKISKSESRVRCENHNEYIFAVSDEQDIDGAVDWNPARFINHSCTPNCDAVLENDRIWIVANRNIREGEEVTFNYGFDLEDYRHYPCRCGAASCLGYMVAEEFFDHIRNQRTEVLSAGNAECPADLTGEPRIH